MALDWILKSERIQKGLRFSFLNRSIQDHLDLGAASKEPKNSLPEWILGMDASVDHLTHQSWNHLVSKERQNPF